jgi:hypothetical protein
MGIRAVGIGVSIVGIPYKPYKIMLNNLSENDLGCF